MLIVGLPNNGINPTAISRSFIVDVARGGLCRTLDFRDLECTKDLCHSESKKEISGTCVMSCGPVAEL